MQRLLLFAKRPRLGQVKTRLCPPLLPGQALQLYRAFLQDQLDFLRSFRLACRVELWIDGPLQGEDDNLPIQGIDIVQQGSGELGARLLRAFRRAQALGSKATVVLGVDSPTLPAEHVRDAFDALARGFAAVIAPAEDGGYVLLGLREPRQELFRGIAWGTSGVFEQTCRRATESKIELLRLDAWYDVDDGRGLDRLRRDLAGRSERRRAPATARLLGKLDGPRSGMV